MKLSHSSFRFPNSLVMSLVLVLFGLSSCNLAAQKAEKLLEERLCNQCNLKGVDLTDADLKEIPFESATVQDANLSGADLRQAGFNSGTLEAVNLEKANLNQANFDGTFMDDVALDQTNLAEAVLTRVSGSEISLIGAALQQAEMTHLSLSDVNLAGANLQDATLRHSDLQTVDLTDANLQNAILVGTTLFNADLTNADLRGADLTAAVIDRASLANAEIDSSTIMPNGQPYSAESFAADPEAALTPVEVPDDMARFIRVCRKGEPVPGALAYRQASRLRPFAWISPNNIPGVNTDRKVAGFSTDEGTGRGHFSFSSAWRTARPESVQLVVCEQPVQTELTKTCPYTGGYTVYYYKSTLDLALFEARTAQLLDSQTFVADAFPEGECPTVAFAEPEQTENHIYEDFKVDTEIKTWLQNWVETP